MFSINDISATDIYGNYIFDKISATFLPTSITYITGKNGSGKTTLLRILAGINKPIQGSITFGKNKIHVDQLAKPWCLYLGHDTAIIKELSVYDNINYWAKLYGSQTRVAAALHYFQLEALANEKCHDLSAGNKQKVALCRLLACDSNLWLLDEPEQNLDDHNQNLLEQIIINKADNGGIIIIAKHGNLNIKSANELNMHDYE